MIEITPLGSLKFEPVCRGSHRADFRCRFDRNTAECHNLLNLLEHAAAALTSSIVQHQVQLRNRWANSCLMGRKSKRLLRFSGEEGSEQDLVLGNAEIDSNEGGVSSRGSCKRRSSNAHI